MGRFIGYIAGGIAVAVLGIGLMRAGQGEFSSNPVEFFGGAVFISVGMLIAQVGTIGWGVFIGSQHLQDSLPAKPTRPAPGPPAGDRRDASDPGSPMTDAAPA